MHSIISLFKSSFYFIQSIFNTMLKINRFKYFLAFFCLLAAIHWNVSALAPGDIPQSMIDAFKSGNTTELAKYFNTSIELAILDQEDIYSKQQAELIVKDFFTKHVPTGFTILHKGGKEGSQYAIGSLTTTAGNFRVTLLIKLRDNKPFIHQLRLEEGNAE